MNRTNEDDANINAFQLLEVLELEKPSLAELQESYPGFQHEPDTGHVLEEGRELIVRPLITNAK